MFVTGCVFGACVYEGGGGGVMVKASCFVSVCLGGGGGGWQELGQMEKKQRQKSQAERKEGSCRSGCIYRSVVKRSHLWGMRPLPRRDRQGTCLKAKDNYEAEVVKHRLFC